MLLMNAHTVKELAELSTIPIEKVQTLLRFLQNAGALTLVDESGCACEASQPELQTWEFHDLLFHTRTRVGRTLGRGFGGTYRFWETMPSPPVTKPPEATSFIPLFRPAIDKLSQTDMPLAKVMESRRSIRKYGKTPVSAEQLGEFLFRVARIRSVYEVTHTVNGHSKQMTLSDRPWPGGGARYALELYVAISQCSGINSGFLSLRPT